MKSVLRPKIIGKAIRAAHDFIREEEHTHRRLEGRGEVGSARTLPSRHLGGQTGSTSSTRVAWYQDNF
jgi:membrane carboxypeptidase/penicillin-binding protein